MSGLRVLRDRLRALLQSSRVHGEIDEELRFHVEMRAADNVAHGMSPNADAWKYERSRGHAVQP